ncbi:MAG: TPM domain-containing protein [Oscillospiraceae bacterium]|jgi:uncharacterized membrane protein YgcG|nr:TPM domain-containing protein [Oscillospiraceae bacterium]
MRRLLSLISVLLCAFLLTGFSIAPVSPTKGLFVNDYATSLFSEHKEFITDISTVLEEQTGAQVIVLAVKNRDGLDAATYAGQIFTGWQFNGDLSDNAVIILLSKEDKELFIAAGDGLSGIIDPHTIAQAYNLSASYVEGGNYSKAIFEAYKTVALKVVTHYGVPLEDSVIEQLQPGVQKERFGGFYGMLIFFVVAVFIAVRSLLVSRKYQKRYARQNYYKRKNYTVERRAFDEDDDDDAIYTIGYDDKDS